MTENNLKTTISFQELLEVVLALGTAEKKKILELLETDTSLDEIDSLEDSAEVEAARTDYETGNYVKFDEYTSQIRHAEK
jgi:hypothetical protein